MTEKSYLRDWSVILCILAILTGISLRFIGLGHRMPSPDEEHYRGNMTNSQLFFETGRFRNHSVKHGKYAAPHGLMGPWLSLRVAWPLNSRLRNLMPAHDYYRENFLARLAYAIQSSLTVGVMFLLAFTFFGLHTALFLAALTALSPHLINWGRSEYLDTPMTFFAFSSFLSLAWLLRAKKEWHQIALAVATGIFAGLMLATKWTGIVIFPFVLFILYFSKNLQVSFPRRVLICGIVCASFIGCSLLWLSLDSFAWALFPKIVDPELKWGDMNDGFLSMMRTGWIKIWTMENLYAVLWVWGGLLLPSLMVLTAKMAATGQLKNDPRVFFVFTLLACGVFIGIFQESYFSHWRAVFLVPTVILSMGFVVEQAKSSHLRLGLAVLLLLTLPLSVREGLRLGKPKATYYGSHLVYSDQLPESASGIFP